MARDITIKLKSGVVMKFPNCGRGGRQTKYVRYEGDRVIVTDEFGNEKASFPAGEVEEVDIKNAKGRGG